MTRTARAAYPRAIIKDRSEAKNAMNKRIPKSGAGGHNWGDLQHEYDYVEAALRDEEAELRDDNGMRLHLSLCAHGRNADAPSQSSALLSLVSARCWASAGQAPSARRSSSKPASSERKP